MKGLPTNIRRCERCGAKLSLYNWDVICYPCQEKETASELEKYGSRARLDFLNSLRAKTVRVENTRVSLTKSAAIP